MGGREPRILKLRWILKWHYSGIWSIESKLNKRGPLTVIQASAAKVRSMHSKRRAFAVPEQENEYFSQ